MLVLGTEYCYSMAAVYSHVAQFPLSLIQSRHNGRVLYTIIVEEQAFQAPLGDTARGRMKTTCSRYIINPPLPLISAPSGHYHFI